MFGWIKGLTERYWEWVRAGYTGGPWASRGEPDWPEPAPPPPPPPPPPVLLSEWARADSPYTMDKASGRLMVISDSDLNPPSPSVPVGLLPPGNEEFRRQRIADAMKNDPAAKYMRGPAPR